MIRLAVIFESSPFDRKGLFNAVHNRVKHLAALDRCEIDVFCIHSRDNAFTRYVRHTPQTPDVESVEIDGLSYRMLWYEFSMTDHMMLEILHVRPLYFRSFIRRCLGQLEGYDIVSAHSFTGSLLAYKAHQMYGIPYFVTWHGSDVHTHPWRIPVILEDTARIMENAVCNFFVSRSLLETSDRITVRASKEVLRNGVSEDFFRYDAEKVDRLRKVFGLEEGTKVVLTLVRDGESDYLEVPVERRKIESPTVSTEMMDDGIGYIEITEFDDVTEDQFAEALAECKAKGMKGLILDLRSNPGGNLSTVCEISRMLLPKGMIVYTEDKYGRTDEYTCDGMRQLQVPAVVLVNGYSASASEILAGALQDYGVATIVGTQSYGKGIVQSVLDLQDGTALKLTTAKYYTPNGNNIHEIGITPDVEVDLPEELKTEVTLSYEEDVQLQKAIEVLQQ